MTEKILQGDCLDRLPEIPDASISVIITDPPYGLADLRTSRVTKTLTKWLAGERDFVPDGRGFMSKEWDKFVPPPAAWDECFRVLKPGGLLLSFAAARTQDLMGMSIRLAGFDIRDSIAWLHSQAMALGSNLGRRDPEWDGWHTALKSGHEPIIVARKPLDGTALHNQQNHGTGSYNIDATRVPASEPGGRPLRIPGGLERNEDGLYSHQNKGSRAAGSTSLGRFTPNVILDADSATLLDEQSGVLTSGKEAPGGHRRNAKSDDSGGIYGGGKGLFLESGETGSLYGDSGGASRFYTVLPAFRYCAKAPGSERPSVDGKGHVTVKPLSLMRFLVRLTASPGSVILDPFAGSGTTLEAAKLEGFDAIGVELDPSHIEMIHQRLARHG